MVEVSWRLFIIATLVIIATPGQDTMMLMSRLLAQGAAADVVTAGQLRGPAMPRLCATANRRRRFPRGS
ncbi:MAG: hypothetical protein ABI854_10090 [Betaproteobacteria bacterium]